MNLNLTLQGLNLSIFAPVYFQINFYAFGASFSSLISLFFPLMSNNQNSNVYGIVITILLALAAGIGFFFWQQSKSFFAENEKIKMEREMLEMEKISLESSLDSLSNAYSELRTENESLQGRVNATAQLVQQKEANIRNIKDANAKDIKDLRTQLADLKRVKIEIETIVAALRAENEALKLENQRLTDENSQLKGSNTELTGMMQDLAKQLEDQIRKTQSAAFKATAFSVQLERRNDKLTTRAKKLREIFVSFDLASVPKTFQGQQKIYLVITDDKGNPILSTNPTKATVYAPSGAVEIIAQQIKETVLDETQRLSFSHKFDDRLKPGHYVVAIYCEKGLLGASSFKLA
jgi:hypothetical protein